MREEFFKGGLNTTREAVFGFLAKRFMEDLLVFQRQPGIQAHWNYQGLE
jgi:hypothetical protein